MSNRRRRWLAAGLGYGAMIAGWYIATSPRNVAATVIASIGGITFGIAFHYLVDHQETFHE